MNGIKINQFANIKKYPKLIKMGVSKIGSKIPPKKAQNLKRRGSGGFEKKPKKHWFIASEKNVDVPQKVRIAKKCPPPFLAIFGLFPIF
jgi:hypothetical protein